MKSFAEGFKSSPNSKKVVIDADFEKVNTSFSYNEALINAISIKLQQIKQCRG